MKRSIHVRHGFSCRAFWVAWGWIAVFLVWSPAIKASSCDCRQSPLPACAPSPLKSPFLVGTLSEDSQLTALQGYAHLKRSLDAVAPARKPMAERSVEQFLGRPLSRVNPMVLGSPDSVLSTQLARARLAPMGGENEMKWPGVGPPSEGQPVVFPPGDPQVLDETGKCTRPATEADRITLSGASRLLVGIDYPEVGRIYSRPSVAATKISHCNFVLLSNRWAVTALHCLKDPAAPKNVPQVFENFNFVVTGKRLGFFLAPNGEQPSQTKRSCLENAPGASSKDCPLHRIKVLRAVFKKPITWVGDQRNPLPQTDLALLELQPDTVPASIRTAVWGGAPLDSGPKTLVATGITTDRSRAVGYELQVGYIPSGILSEGFDRPARVYTWENNTESRGAAVCPGDSGGAVFDGWDDGLCRCASGRPINVQRSLFALVSYSVQAEENACAERSTSAAIVLADHRAWMCQQAPDLPTCRTP